MKKEIKGTCSDSALWRNKQEDKILRGVNVRETTYVETNLLNFKNMNHKKKNGKISCVNEFVHNIYRVYKFSTDRAEYEMDNTNSIIPHSKDGYLVVYENPKVDKDVVESEEAQSKKDEPVKVTRKYIAVFTNGAVQKGKAYYEGDTIKEIEKSSRVTSYKESGHLRTTVFCGKRHTDVSLERLMMIAHCVYHGTLPSNLDGLSCNVKDGSGSLNNVFGVEYNIHPDNLEWCTVSENSKHYQTLKELRDRTGNVYRISAYDTSLHDAVFTRPLADIIWYIQRTGIKQVK